MKQRAFVSAILFWFTLASVVAAGEVAGVKMPDTTSFEGRTLKLNGMGLRKKVVFKVYVAALYLETPSKDAAAVISSNQIRSMRLHVLRNLGASKITEAISEGFEKNSRAQMGALKARLQKFNAMFPDVKEGDEIEMTYVPEKGTIVTARGAEKGVIEGKDFADALFSVWLGASPVQEDLKRDLLRG